MCASQPLMDNLESQTYEVFERDPVKYKLYEEVRVGPSKHVTTLGGARD